MQNRSNNLLMQLESASEIAWQADQSNRVSLKMLESRESTFRK